MNWLVNVTIYNSFNELYKIIMAKTVINTATTTTITNKKRSAAASEIDDIFTKKLKPSTSTTSTNSLPTQSTSSLSSIPLNKKSKKSTTSLSLPTTMAVDPKGKSKQQNNEPETILDPSAFIDSYRNESAPGVGGNKKRKAGGGVEGDGGSNAKAQDEEDRFMDSRGTAS